MEQKVKEAVEKHLRALKTQIHNKAVFPSYKGDSAYITLKSFDGIINNYINNLQADGENEK